MEMVLPGPEMTADEALFHLALGDWEPGEAARWWRAGVRDQHVARVCAEAGLEPDRTRGFLDAGLVDPIDIVRHHKANLDPAATRLLSDAGLSPVEQRRFVRTEVSPWRLSAYLNAQVDDLAFITAADAADLDSLDAGGYLDAGIGTSDLDVMVRLRAGKVSGADAVGFAAAAVFDADEMLALTARGVTGTVVSLYVEVGVRDVDAVEALASASGRGGVTPDEVLLFRSIGVTDPADMLRLHEAGAFAKRAVGYAATGCSFDDLCRLGAAGLDGRTVALLADVGIVDIDEIIEICSAALDGDGPLTHQIRPLVRARNAARRTEALR